MKSVIFWLISIAGAVAFDPSPMSVFSYGGQNLIEARVTGTGKDGVYVQPKTGLAITVPWAVAEKNSQLRARVKDELEAHLLPSPQPIATVQSNVSTFRDGAVTREMGRWDRKNGSSLSMSICDDNGVQTAQIYVRDEHGINTVLFSRIERDELLAAIRLLQASADRLGKATLKMP